MEAVKNLPNLLVMGDICSAFWFDPNPSNSSNIGHGSSSVLAPNNSTNNTTTEPSQNTGIPYGLLALAAVMVSAGVVYAKFLR